MCFMILGFCKKERIARSVIQAITDEMKLNSHGFAILTKNSLVRTLDFQKAQEALREISNGFFHIHFRLASVGAITLENVHLWDGYPFYLSHNGTTSGYYNKFTKNSYTEIIDEPFTAKLFSQSDTVDFLNRNVENIVSALYGDFQPLKSVVETLKSYSLFFVSNKEFNRFLLVSWRKPIQVYLLRDKNSRYSVVYASDEIEFVGTELMSNQVKKGWSIKTMNCEVIHFEVSNSICLLDADGNLKMREKLEVPYRSQTLWGGYQDYYGWHNNWRNDYEI